MQESLQIFTASSGNISARVFLDDNTTRHLHSTVRPEAESAFFEDLAIWGTVIVFAGVGLGYHLGTKIREISPDALLVVIDYYDALIEHNRTTTFAGLSNNIITLSSSNLASQQHTLTAALRSLRRPLAQTIRHPASFEVHKDFYTTALAVIDDALFLRKSTKTRAKKALLLHGNFFLQEECRRALEQISGTPPPLLRYEACRSPAAFESHLYKTIQKDAPDCILSINMKGFDGNGILAEAALRFSIPVVVWFVDDPHPILLHQGAGINRNMIALSWEKSCLPFLEKSGFTRARYLPLAADPGLLTGHNKPLPPVPLGFVGTSMHGAFLDTIKSRFLWSDALVPLIEKSSDEICADPGAGVARSVARAAAALSLPLPFTDTRNFTWLCACVLHTASMKKRKAIISALLPLGVETFGDPQGWTDMLTEPLTAHPDIDYRTELGDVYRRIHINLNITSCQMPTAVNQRVFDIPAAGGFVLSDNQEDMGELFDLGTEAVCYRTIPELHELICYYSKNEQERAAIIAAAQKRIFHDHTYHTRLRDIMRLLEKGF